MPIRTRIRYIIFRTLFALFVLVASICVRAGEPLPSEFDAALKSFRADGTKGWAFVQTTSSTKHSLKEQFDPSKLEFKRWSLIEKDGHAPTEEERKDYEEKQTRRSRGDTAPDVTKQLDLSTAEKVSEDSERSVYRFRLTPGGKDDTSAQYMTSTFTFHKPTKTIERIELTNTEPFSPMLAVRIQEARTTINYTLPTAERPTLLDKITVRVRGRAMLVRSLDEDLTVAYSDYRYVGKAPPPPVMKSESRE
jgi:outer membrane lipoprotein-sorting protein